MQPFPDLLPASRLSFIIICLRPPEDDNSALQCRKPRAQEKCDSQGGWVYTEHDPGAGNGPFDDQVPIVGS